MLAGWALGAALFPAPVDVGRIALGCAASVAVYHAGMALNDYADRGEDARSRPGRPIPSGAVAPGEALGTGLILLASSLVFGSLAGNLALVAPLAALVLVYDLGIRRGSWLGPVALGGARALNLSAGVALAVPDPRGGVSVCVAAGYGAYVAAVSLVAIGEDRPWSGRRAACAAALAVAGLAAAASALSRAPAASAAPLLWCVLLEPASILLGPSRPWTPDRVGALVGAGLRGTLVFDAVVAASAGRPGVAAICGLGYAIARLTARWIPPT